MWVCSNFKDTQIHAKSKERVTNAHLHTHLQNLCHLCFDISRIGMSEKKPIMFNQLFLLVVTIKWIASKLSKFSVRKLHRTCQFDCQTYVNCMMKKFCWDSKFCWTSFASMKKGTSIISHDCSTFPPQQYIQFSSSHSIEYFIWTCWFLLIQFIINMLYIFNPSAIALRLMSSSNCKTRNTGSMNKKSAIWFL